MAPPQILKTLLYTFVPWKILLAAIALGSAVGYSYDTSSTLLLPHGHGRFNESPPNLVARLTRWDGIWFTGIASRGYTFEQSWAFGTGLPTAISLITKTALSSDSQPEGDGFRQAVVGIAIANASHFFSALVLYHFVIQVSQNARLALVAALLHVFTPAGMFMSAPYAESPHALLSFLGFWLLSKAYSGNHSGFLAGDACIAVSGLLFGLATTFRSNGILNGVPFAVDFIATLSSFVRCPQASTARRIVALGLGGAFVGLGSLIPQGLAYMAFCSSSTNTSPRPWCQNRIPSIYTFVQEHYWDNGFLRYWTPNNIGNFVLGSPMIFIMIKSAVDVLGSHGMCITGHTQASASQHAVAEKDTEKDVPKPPKGRGSFLLTTMAISQLLLALLSVTNHHVQIITRLSSGYPIWYLWLASLLQNIEKNSMAKKVVVFLVMYGLIQGVLFACFLPPA